MLLKPEQVKVIRAIGRMMGFNMIQVVDKRENFGKFCIVVGRDSIEKRNFIDGNTYCWFMSDKGKIDKVNLVCYFCWKLWILIDVDMVFNSVLDRLSDGDFRVREYIMKEYERKVCVVRI